MLRSSSLSRLALPAGAVAVACALALPAGAAPSGPADTPVNRKITRDLRAANPGCNVEISHAGQVSGALVAVYVVDGCNGGNNWLTSAQVYGLKGGTLRPIGKPMTWSIVDGVAFDGQRALIRALDEAPGDGHCCPTAGKTVEVTVQDGQPVFRQIATWKGKGADGQ